MSEAKHTPGPWTYRESISQEKSAYGIAVPATVVSIFRDEQGRRCTAFVCVCNSTTIPNDDNARLIAAAPELLEALKYPRFGDTAHLLDQAVEQIKKMSERLNELTGENWTPLYLNHYANAAATIRAAIAKAEKKMSRIDDDLVRGLDMIGKARESGMAKPTPEDFTKARQLTDHPYVAYINVRIAHTLAAEREPLQKRIAELEQRIETLTKERDVSLAIAHSRSHDGVAELEKRIAASRKRLGDLKAVHSSWYDGDGRPEWEVIAEMEQIAYSVLCYLDGVPGLYLPSMDGAGAKDFGTGKRLKF